jgi:serine/threonine protein kinase
MLLPGVYKLDGPEWEHVSSSAKDMVQKMMELDPQKRWTAKELLGHVWFQVRVYK